MTNQGYEPYPYAKREWQYEVAQGLTELSYEAWASEETPEHLTSASPRPNIPVEPYEYWGEHLEPNYALEEWKYSVANDETRLGYWDWVRSMIEATEEMFPPKEGET